VFSLLEQVIDDGRKPQRMQSMKKCLKSVTKSTSCKSNTIPQIVENQFLFT